MPDISLDFGQFQHIIEVAGIKFDRLIQTLDGVSGGPEVPLHGREFVVVVSQLGLQPHGATKGVSGQLVFAEPA